MITSIKEEIQIKEDVDACNIYKKKKNLKKDN